MHRNGRPNIKDTIIHKYTFNATEPLPLSEYSDSQLATTIYGYSKNKQNTISKHSKPIYGKK